MIQLSALVEEIKAGRTLHVYDFDDTLANSEVSVYVKMKNGERVKLSSHEFAKYSLEPGDFFDFSEFNKLIKSATPITQYVSQLKQSLANSQIKTTILTARALAYPVRYWLKTVAGVDAYVVAVEGSNPKLKADWIENQAKKGYTNIKFIDDSQKNLDAVAERLAPYNVDLTLINPLTDKEALEEDRCKRIADRKYSKPSAYKSGAIVRCRKGNIWKGLKEEKKETLRTWFARKGAPGKEGGWVDCNTCRNGKCKSCGRKKGEKRAKYPSCRPTPAQCKSPGKGKKWGKTLEEALSLYHSTTSPISGEWRVKGKNNSWGIFFTKKKNYSQVFGDLTYKVILDPQNTLELNDSEVRKTPFFNMNKEQYENYINQGYDSIVWYRNGVLTEFIVLDPSIIKDYDLIR